MVDYDAPMYLWITLGCSFFVYFVVGVLLTARSNLRPISSRSPWLLIIAHFFNFLDLALFYQALWQYKTKASHYKAYYTSVTLVCHYMYYFPYLLRCYRLRFVFTLDKNWESQNDFFRKHIQRSRQSWLLIILMLLMLPVFVVAVLIGVFPDIISVIPDGGAQQTDLSLRSDALYILICFIEEVLFVLSVFQLRKVEDHFNMTRELTFVCCLWLCNSAFAKYSNELWWLYECIARNWLLMLISSLWPVYKSFRGAGFSETITSEVANSLELLLQNQFTLDYFEKFLIRGEFSKERRDSGIATTEKVPDHIGEVLLDFWLQCEIYRNDPGIGQAKQIYAQYISLDAKLNVDLPMSLLTDIRSALDAGDPGGVLYVSAQEFVFSNLRDYYFALFQRSPEYSKMMREITRQEIYINRLVLTSLHGKLLYQ